MEIRKNNEYLGKVNNIPTNVDLVPCVSLYYEGNEVESMV